MVRGKRTGNKRSGRVGGRRGRVAPVLRTLQSFDSMFLRAAHGTGSKAGRIPVHSKEWRLQKTFRWETTDVASGYHSIPFTGGSVFTHFVPHIALSVKGSTDKAFLVPCFKWARLRHYKCWLGGSSIGTSVGFSFSGTDFQAKDPTRNFTDTSVASNIPASLSITPPLEAQQNWINCYDIKPDGGSTNEVFFYLSYTLRDYDENDPPVLTVDIELELWSPFTSLAYTVGLDSLTGGDALPVSDESVIEDFTLLGVSDA